MEVAVAARVLKVAVAARVVKVVVAARILKAAVEAAVVVWRSGQSACGPGDVPEVVGVAAPDPIFWTSLPSTFREVCP